MNILFVTSAAPKKSPFFTDEKRPPLGLGSLMSVVRKHGHTVFFIDNYLKQTDFVKDGYLQKNEIDFVGIYVNTICYRDSMKMFTDIERLRKKGLWNGKIIAGGPHTSVALDTIPDFVDYVVQGEGEQAILKIINGEAKQRIVKEERIKDLDSLPFQPWDIFTKLPYDYSCKWMDTKPVFTMNTSRGCPFDCAFCSVDSVWGKQYTYFSVDRLIDEIKYLIKKFGAKGIYFREDNFTLNRKRVEEFCAKIRELNIKWACETRVDTLCDEELVKMMSKAGCEAVYLGVESGSQKVLDILKKGVTVEQIERCVTLCKKHKIRTYCSLITGVPGETYEDYLLTKKLMNKLKPHAYAFSVFVGIPHSQLYEEILTKKLHEHIDDIGLVYLPGYDVRTEYFYGVDSKKCVDYEFKQRTSFDEELLKELDKNKFKKMVKRTVSVLPVGVVKKVDKKGRLKRLYKKMAR